MIEARSLVKRYGSVEAVRGVSFEVKPGEIVGLLGPNGAGKTTIMKILTGYHFPTAGQARLAGIDVEEDPVSAKRALGYLPETAPLYVDLTVLEYLGFVADMRNLEGARRKERIAFAVAECGLESVAFRPIDQLSKGFRQRVGIAQAILHDPAILILDEPTTGLDPNQILGIRELIRRLGREKTVLLSTHILQEVEAVCSRVLILNEGVIAAEGTTASIADSLKGETVFVATFRGMTAEALQAAIPGIPGFLDLESVTALAGGEARAHFSLENSDDAGVAVFDWAVANGLRISEMNRNRVSLEDVFVKLTGEGDKAWTAFSRSSARK